MIHFFPGSFILKKISFKNFSETITNLAPSLHEALTAHYAGRTSFFVVFSEVKTSHGQLRPKNLVVFSTKKKKRAKGILSSSKSKEVRLNNMLTKPLSLSRPFLHVSWMWPLPCLRRKYEKSERRLHG